MKSQQFVYLNSWRVVGSDKRLIDEWADAREGFITYGKPMLDDIVELIPNVRRTAIDCGAHYGFVSFWLHKAFNSVESFEVAPIVRECLKYNMDLYNCIKVHIHDCGVSDENGFVDVIKAWGENLTSFSTFIAPKASNIKILVEPMPAMVRTIDSFNFQDVDLIKIDVEGFEQKVIRGALDTIDRCSPLIVFEERRAEAKDFKYYNQLYSQYRYSETKTVMDFLEPLGYSIVLERAATHGYKKDLFAMRTK